MDDWRKYLVEAAIRAPSGDNSQPWRFKFISNEQLQIQVVPELAESFFDVNYRATCISVGAVIENIRVAAKYRGFESRVEYPGRDVEVPVVVMHFRPWAGGMPSAREAYDALHRRTVNRRPYLPAPLSEQTWRDILDVHAPEDVTVVGYAGAEKRRWIPAMQAADRIRWTHPRIHAELFAKVRYSREEVLAKRTGLELDRLGVGPAAKFVMTFLRAWERQRAFNAVGGARVLAAQTAALVKACAGLVGVWVRDDSAEAWIRGGEIVQRLWNRAHQCGIAVHPLPVCLYLKRRFDQEGCASFTPDHAKDLDVIADVVNRFAEKCPANNVPVMLFRVGRAVPMKTTAVRKAVSDFLSSVAGT